MFVDDAGGGSGFAALVAESAGGDDVHGESERQPVAALVGADANGGVPRGWMFRVPPGDAARGRQVFARLECFRCHQLRGESFPTPSAAGPELTEASAHHPVGYLVESILNPNAVIVEGPGYIGSDGRSTMPDYRDELSARDLIDLVAYLQTQ